MKYIFALPLILFPYTLLLGLYCLYSGFLMESVFGNNGYLLLFVLFLCAVAAFCFTLPLCLVSLAKRADGRGMALLNMVVKLCHIPAYIAIFFLSLLFLISIWGIVFVVVFVLYDFAAIGMSGAVGAVAACCCAAEGKIGKRGAVLYAVCQFLFCIDVFFCVKLYRRARKGNTISGSSAFRVPSD